MANFEVEELARFTAADVERLLGNTGIVRHRGKIESAINNAQRVLELLREYDSLAHYVWRYAPQAAQERPQIMTHDALRTLTTTAASTALSKDLKKRGFNFVGPTTMYAFMQAMGLVNDHIEGCDTRGAAEVARAKFTPPTWMT